MPFIEQQISFENRQGKTLQGILCGDPKDTSCVVMCYPFADERKNSQPTYVRLARALAECSFIASLRFDYSGCGNSEGDFADSSINVWIEDTICALEEVKALGAIKVIIMGLRLGANIAWYAFKRLECCSYALLWNIIPDIQTYFTNEKKRNSLLSMFGALRGRQKQNVGSGEKTFDLAGYAVGYKLRNDFEKYWRIDIFRLKKDKRIKLGLITTVAEQIDMGEVCKEGVISVISNVPSFWNVPDVHETQVFINRNIELSLGLLNERSSICT